MLARMFGKPKPARVRPTELTQAAAVLEGRIQQLDTQATALHHVTNTLGAQVKSLHKLDPKDVRIRHLFSEYKASARQCADVAAARASLTRKLHALKTKAMAIENMETLSTVQRTLGNRVAPGLLDQFDDALDAIATDADDAEMFSSSLDAHIDDDTDGLDAFLETEQTTEKMPDLPEAPLPAMPDAPTDVIGTNAARSWLEEV